MVERLDIGPMARADLDVALAWAAAEGWDPGLHDADAFWAADPGGHFTGRIGGEQVSTLSAVRYGDELAFLGLYIVAPPWRGQGHGWALWEAVLDGLGGRVLGLDGVVEQEAAYRRDGFEAVWRNERRVLADPAPVRPSGRSVDLAEVGLDALDADDRRTFPGPRRPFLEAWVSQPGAVGRAVVDGGRLAGWGLRRPTGAGWKVGPLVADDAGVAEALLADLVAGASGPVFLDVPGGNPAAGALADRHGMPAMFQTVRMYRGEPPAVEDDRVFGVTTFELG